MAARKSEGQIESQESQERARKAERKPDRAERKSGRAERKPGRADKKTRSADRKPGGQRESQERRQKTWSADRIGEQSRATRQILQM